MKYFNMINTSEAFSHAPQTHQTSLSACPVQHPINFINFAWKKEKKKNFYVLKMNLLFRALQITSHQNDRSVYVLLYLLCEFIYFKYYTRNVCGSNEAMDNSLSFYMHSQTHQAHQSRFYYCFDDQFTI